MSRLSAWVSSPELEPPRDIALSEAVSLASDESGNWRGSTLYLYHKEGWTIFEVLSGHFGSLPAATWKLFAQNDSFVFAGYNDAIGYGELTFFENWYNFGHFSVNATSRLVFAALFETQRRREAENRRER